MTVVRLDEDTGERFYDVKAEDPRLSDNVLKWVPRAAIRLHPKSADQVGRTSSAPAPKPLTWSQSRGANMRCPALSLRFEGVRRW